MALEALTTRARCHRLGVDPTAIYRHFRSKNELVNAPADRVVGTGTRPPVTVALLRSAGLTTVARPTPPRPNCSTPLAMPCLRAPFAALDLAQAAELAASRVMYQMLPARDYPSAIGNPQPPMETVMPVRK
jgi:AcrR family transcriptional regulator